MSTISKALVYTVAGVNYTSHKEAKAAQDGIDRLQRLKDSVLFDREGGLFSVEFIAENATKFIDALTIPSGRAPRKPKATATAA